MELISVSMRRNLVADISDRFPGYYRQDIIKHRCAELGLSGLKTAKLAEINRETIRDVLAGKASSKKVWPVANVLGLDWAQLHNFELKPSEFHLAVRNGKRG